MRKLIIMTLCLGVLVIGSVSFAGDFRDTTWGMTKEQVKKAETASLYQDDPGKGRMSMLMYNPVKIMGSNYAISYLFCDKKLVVARYINMESYYNKNNYVNDYLSVNTTLKEKYGEPSKEIMKWYNNLYKGDVQYYGMAISLGHLRMNNWWYTDTSRIINNIMGKKFKVTHGVEYSSIKYYDLWQECLKERRKGNF